MHLLFALIAIFITLKFFSENTWLLYVIGSILCIGLIAYIKSKRDMSKANARKRAIEEDEKKQLEEDLKNEEAQALKKVEKLVEKHAIILLKKKKESIFKDDYGNTIDSAWNKEIEYFFTNVINNDSHPVIIIYLGSALILKKFITSSQNDIDSIDIEKQRRISVLMQHTRNIIAKLEDN